MKKQWNVTVNGIQHEIEYKAGWGTKLIVDGQTHKLKSKNPFMVLIDCPVTIDGAEIRVVAIGNKVDLAVNGIYQGNQTEYIPVRNVAAWTNVLIGISSIGGLLMCGWLGLCIGILFGTLYVRLNLKAKNGLVIISFIGCTAIQIAIMLAVRALQESIR